MNAIPKSRWKRLLARAKTGSAEAQWEVGYYYESGAADKSGNVLARTNPLQARRWYELAAKQGNTAAQLALSNLLSTGDDIPRDDKSAIYWARKAIAQRDASAAFNLGTIYRDQNKPTMAFQWYKQAASMGHGDSYVQLGLCCLFGFGTKQDLGKAYRFLNKVVAGKPSTSCQRTKENALYWISVIQLLGIGKTKRSVAAARKMLESANAGLDHEQANEILNVIGKSRYLSA